ncbi:hypothetical protein DIPPA_12929 [Diplonema papillatum]|nr:hypothetical protein DIPPA_12929 [Diplonema papillatum]
MVHCFPMEKKQAAARTNSEQTQYWNCHLVSRLLKLDSNVPDETVLDDLHDTFYPPDPQALEQGARIALRDPVGGTLLHRLLLEHLIECAGKDVLEHEFNRNASHYLELRNGDWTRVDEPRDLPYDELFYDGETALHIAVAKGDVDIVNLLLSRDVSCRSRAYGSFFAPGSDTGCYYGEYALSFAASTGRTDIVGCLLDSDPGAVYLVDSFGNTAFHLAILHARIDAYRDLIARSGQSARDVAVLHGNRDVDTVNLLLSRDVSCRSRAYGSFFAPGSDTGCYYGEYALSFAASTGRTDIVGCLLDSDPGAVYLVDSFGNTAFHLAILHARIDAYRDLIARSGQSARDVAVLHGNRDVDTVNLLLSRDVSCRSRAYGSFFAPGSDTGCYYGEYALSFAASTGRTDIVGCLLDSDPGAVYLVDSFGNTAFHLAILHARIDAYRDLIARSGQSARDVAVLHGNRDVDTVNLLLSRDVSCRSRAYGSFFAPGSDTGCYYGEYALSFAASTGRTDIVGCLLDSDPGAVYLVDSFGNTAFHLAILHARIDAYRDLIARSGQSARDVQ